MSQRSFPLFVSRARDQRKHAIHDRGGKRKDDSADHRHGRIEPCRGRREKVLHQHDVAVVDQHLAGKENQRLECFAKSIPKAKWVGNRGAASSARWQDRPRRSRRHWPRSRP